MIKTLMTWIFGEKPKENPVVAEAPYKVEAPEAKEVLPVTDAGVPVTIPVTATATSPVEVKAKFKKSELAKMTKKELLDLAADKGLTVKARLTKDELVQALLKS